MQCENSFFLTSLLSSQYHFLCERQAEERKKPLFQSLFQQVLPLVWNLKRQTERFFPTRKKTSINKKYSLKVS